MSASTKNNELQLLESQFPPIFTNIVKINDYEFVGACRASGLDFLALAIQASQSQKPRDV